MQKILLIVFLSSFCACMQTQSNDDELRIVPVTNNPHIVPNHGSGLPMMGSQQGPY